MSDVGWIVLENIVWAAIAAGCLFLLDGSYKWFALLPLICLNTFSRK